MQIRGKKVVVTGGESGIGKALVDQLRQAGATVCIFDTSAGEVRDPLHITCDVSDETAVRRAIKQAKENMGRIDIYVSNAGVLSEQPEGAVSASNADWARCWSVNVMAHVYSGRALLPEMTKRGSGYFVVVASAAGLLNQIGDAAYSATKHAAVSFAESLAIWHGPDGVGVSLVCPQYVATSLIGLSAEDAASKESLLTAEDVALSILQAVEAGQFLVLPHPQVAAYALSRAQDHEEWIKGMIRLKKRALDRFGDARPERFYQLL